MLQEGFHLFKYNSPNYKEFRMKKKEFHFQNNSCKKQPNIESAFKT